jgi:hypothetical protein
MALPQQLTLPLLQTQWAALLNPVLANPILQGLQLTGIKLLANTPFVINHLLSRNQIGYFITDITSNANVWRTAPLNNKTLTLEASANTTLALWVY